MVAGVMGPVLASGLSVAPAAFTVSAGAALAVAAVAASAAPAKAATGSVLILSTSVTGGSSSAEAAAVPSGYTVTVASPATWDAMTTTQFAAYSAIIIGDPSGASCATAVPSDALSTAATWGAAVTGNVAVVGTAPAFAGPAGATLLKDGIGYAVSGSGTGLYVSLNCDYSGPGDAPVPLLAHVDGGGFEVTGHAAGCPNTGRVNTWEADALTPFNGLASSTWAAPACSVEETFLAWPAALSGVAYLSGASPQDFTASDGQTGQPYVLAGAPASTATQALAPSTGGEVPAGAAAGGGNAAAPGVGQATAGDPVDTENGDFSQFDTDLSIPGFGPSLDFTRTYDAELAQQQTVAGTPGPMGYGWTDDWASSMTSGVPVPGDIYTMDGLRTNNGNGGPPLSQPVNSQGAVRSDGNLYIASTGNNRVLEVAGSTGTQWGISMTAGDMYVIAGSPAGSEGGSPNGTPASQSLLENPTGLALDSSGDLFIADTGNNRIVEIPAVAGQNRGFGTMTAGDMYTIAGSASGTAGHSGNGGAATSALLDQPQAITFGPSDSDLYVADSGNSRVQEIPAEAGTQWGQSMTAWDMYTIAGSASGTAGISGDGGSATSARLNNPDGVSLSSAGDLYIADTGNNRIQEVPKASGAQWGITPSFTADDMYTIAGSAAGSSGHSASGTKASSALLNQPEGIGLFNGMNVYIADSGDNYVEEISHSAHSEWGISMAANDIYTVAGTGSGGFSGDGGPATAATLHDPAAVTLDPSHNLFIADGSNHRVREVSAATGDISTYAGNGYTLWSTGNGGPATTAGLHTPDGVASDGAGNIYIADTSNNRVQEIAASSHTQFGITMTAGDVYTVAGSAHASGGSIGDGGPATSAFLLSPQSVAVDAAGNLFIADAGNNRVQEVPATTGGGKTAGDIYTIAGSASGVQGLSGDGGPAASALLDDPAGVAVDGAGDVFIADYANNRIQEVPAATGGGKTAGDMYTIAGSATGASGLTGDGGAATSALLDFPAGIAADAAGDVYIADSANNRVQEVFASGGSTWGQSMTAGDIYTIAGQATGTSGAAGDGGPATSASLSGPTGIAADSAGDLYIADASNNRIQEVAAASGTQWSQQMTADDIYTVAGQASGTGGNNGNGGPATSAKMQDSDFVATDPSGNLYITDYQNNILREVVSATGSPFLVSPATPGITISQPDGSQITFYPKGTGCTAPYVQAGTSSYCTLPQDINATLAYSTATATWTYSPEPGTTYTYTSAGALTTESDSASDILAINPGPAPGTGHCPSAAATCQTITGADGRAITVGSSASGLITSATDPLGREWTYGYNAASDLTTATDPMGNITSYTYGPGSAGGPEQTNDLLTITAPNAQPGGPDAGDATVNAYNAAGQVTSQTDPMGHTTTFTYCASATSGDCMNEATGTGLVTVTDPDGNTTVDSYQQGTLAAQTSYTGAISTADLTSEQDTIPDTTAPTTANPGGGTLLNTATADGNGNITTYTYDSAGDQTSATAPDGIGSQTATTTEWTSAAAEGNATCSSEEQASATCSPTATGPAPVVPAGVITPPSAAPPQGVTWSLYDTDGNQLYTTAGVYQPGASTASYSQTTYQLYAGNRVTLPGTSTPVTCTASPPSPSLPCAAINADGTVTQLAYNSNGDLASSSAPDGNGSQIAQTIYGYDADGEQTSTTLPDGNLAGANAGNYTTVTTYNADGQMSTVTQAGGTGATVTPRTTTYGYDADGNQTSAEDARDFTTTTAYNADDQNTLDTSPQGNATLTCYDDEGNVAQTVPPRGVVASGLTASSCPKSYPVGYTDDLAPESTVDAYDADGNLTSETTPAPAGQSGYEITTYDYDGDGNVIRTTAPPDSNGGAGQVTADTYNSDDELASETTGSGTTAASTTTYCYNPNGDQTSVVMPDGNTTSTAACETSSPWVVSGTANPTQADYQTTSSYDSADELVSSTSPATTAAPSGATTSYTYDPAGNKLTATDPDGVTTNWTYTPANQPATQTYSGSSAHSVSYGYNADGDQTSMTDATGSSSYTADPFGELTAATNGAGQTVGYGYDADGDNTSVTYPLPPAATWAASDTVTYGYNNDDVVKSITDFNGNEISITNSADSLPTAQTLASTGDSIATTYDNTDAPSAIALKSSTATLQSFDYSDAPDSRVLTETDTPSGSNSPVTYTYDSLGRVTSMTPGTGSAHNYSSDASGNLSTLPTGASGQYNDASELTSSSISGITTSYSYNADGQRTTASQGGAAVASAGWNGAGAVTSYGNGNADMTAAVYDGNGLRASATSTPSGGSAITQNFVWAQNGDIPDLIMDTSNAYIYGLDEAPEEQINLATGTRQYLASDGLGSVRGIVSSSGALTASAAYDAWGNPETPGGLASYTPFGYAGAYTDPTGLIYLLDRYYDPVTGQFISVDPDVGQTQDSYGYAAGNPVDTIDPTGAEQEPATWPKRGGSCNDRFTWCDMRLETWVNSLDGKGKLDWDRVTVKVDPGAKASRVQYHAQRMPFGFLLSNIRLHAYVLCFGWDWCADISYKINDNGPGKFTVKSYPFSLNGENIAHAFDLTAQCHACGSPFKPRPENKGRTLYAKCRKRDNVCRYYH
jgi:RHS repeat-associated protein